MVKLCMQDLKEKQFRLGCRERVIYNEGWKLYIFAHESLIKYFVLNSNLPNIYLFKANNRNIRKRCEICSITTLDVILVLFFS